MRNSFLLARFHVKQLCKATTRKEVEPELRNILPPVKFNDNLRSGAGALVGVYQRAVNHVLNHQSRYETARAIKILSWLAKARRNLTVDEVRIAIADVDEESPWCKVDFEDLPMRAMITDLCGGLVTIDGDTDTVRFIHFSVQEYLLENKVVAADHSDLANTCAQHLVYALKLHLEPISSISAATFLEATGEALKKVYHTLMRSCSCDHRFIDYATENLRYHLGLSDENFTYSCVMKLSATPSRVTEPYHLEMIHMAVRPARGWMGSWGQTEPWKTPRGTRLWAARRLGNEGPALKIMAALGFITREMAPFRRRSQDLTFGYGAPIHIASSPGHLAVTMDLIRMNPDSIRATNLTGWMPIQLATKYDNFAVTMFLLQNGALKIPGPWKSLKELFLPEFGEAVHRLISDGNKINIELPPESILPTDTSLPGLIEGTKTPDPGKDNQSRGFPVHGKFGGAIGPTRSRTREPDPLLDENGRRRPPRVLGLLTPVDKWSLANGGPPTIYTDERPSAHGGASSIYSAPDLDARSVASGSEPSVYSAQH